jgi:hypothetical protein
MFMIMGIAALIAIHVEGFEGAPAMRRFLQAQAEKSSGACSWLCSGPGSEGSKLMFERIDRDELCMIS